MVAKVEVFVRLKPIINLIIVVSVSEGLLLFLSVWVSNQLTINRIRSSRIEIKSIFKYRSSPFWTLMQMSVSSFRTFLDCISTWSSTFVNEEVWNVTESAFDILSKFWQSTSVLFLTRIWLVVFYLRKCWIEFEWRSYWWYLRFIIFILHRSLLDFTDRSISNWWFLDKSRNSLFFKSKLVFTLRSNLKWRYWLVFV